MKSEKDFFRPTEEAVDLKKKADSIAKLEKNIAESLERETRIAKLMNEIHDLAVSKTCDQRKELILEKLEALIEIFPPCDRSNPRSNSSDLNMLLLEYVEQMKGRNKVATDSFSKVLDFKHELEAGLYSITSLTAHDFDLIKTMELQDAALFLYLKEKYPENITLPFPSAAKMKEKSELTEEEIRDHVKLIISSFDEVRDLSIYNLNGMGLSQRDIAKKLCISAATVNSGIKKLEKRLDVRMLKHKGGAGVHAGDSYRKNQTIMNRTHHD